MKLLTELLYELDIKNIWGSTHVDISGIHFDSTQVVSFGLFVAVKGERKDGHEFIKDAIHSGAIAIICEDIPNEKKDNITYIEVQNSSLALAVIASNFFNRPSKKIKLIGITGTNGKTSSVYYLGSLFRQLNFKVGIISTIEYQVDGKCFNSTHTTPDSIRLNELLSQMVEVGCDYCFMEVSSHGIAQDRIFGLDFDIAVFTNISRDHLDYHSSFNEYIRTKKIFFDTLSKNAKSIVNIDDEHVQTILMDTKSKKIFYGLNNSPHYKGHILESTTDGLTVSIDKYEISTQLVGDFNIYNLLVAYSVATQFVDNKGHVASLLSNISPVPGRFNTVKTSTNILGIVDYAHTPDALKKAILSISNFCTTRMDLIVVVGCGGDRDRGKRAEMGQIAVQNSRWSIFTSDNPRFEDPTQIIADMCQGVSKDFRQRVKKIINREDAIKKAVELACMGSIILVSGKGHEKFQESGGVKRPFDDMEVLKKYLKI